MKKITALLLALILVLTVALTACSSTEDPKPTETPTGTPTEAPTEAPTDAPTSTPTPTEDPAQAENLKKANAAVEKIAKLSEMTFENYTSYKTKLSAARSAYDKLTDEQKALVSAENLKVLTDAEAAYDTYVELTKKAETLTVLRLMLYTAEVDGEVDVEYRMGTQYTLSKAVIESLGAEAKATGAKIVTNNAEADANFTTTVYFSLDDNYLYVCEKRSDATANADDRTVITFTKNNALVSGLVLAHDGNGTVSLFDESGVSAAKSLYCLQQKKAGDGYTVLECAIELSNLKLTKSDFTKKLVGIALDTTDAVAGGKSYTLQYVGSESLTDCYRFFTELAPDYRYIARGSAVIDGNFDDSYENCGGFELSPLTCAAFTTEESNHGAGIKAGSEEMAIEAGSSFTFRFIVDDEYLYICEQRNDTTRRYTAPSFKQPYLGDGSLIWFTKNGQLVCGLQWNAATVESEEPQIGLFMNDDQNNAALKDYECVVGDTDESGLTLFMEAKIPLADLKLTIEDFENNYVGMTFCTVDVYTEETEIAPANVWDNAYQMQFIGVNNWEYAPRLVINN